MIDKLIFKDVQLTASNDDQYFVFEDLLYQVTNCISILIPSNIILLENTYRTIIFIGNVVFFERP